MTRIAIFLSTLATAVTAFPATYYVDASRPDDLDAATNWATAKQSIQAAVDLTVDGDMVLVTNGIYDAGSAVATGTTLTNRVCIEKAITVQSVNGPNATIIQGRPGTAGAGFYFNAVRGVFMSNGCSLFGFTITNGYTDNGSESDRSGGGAWIAENCQASNCIFSGNAAQYSGGGAYIHGGTVDSCTFENNIADLDRGGGVATSYGASVSHCVIRGNTANDEGGGAYMSIDGGGGTLAHCILSNNVAQLDGGGAYIEGGVVVTNCLVIDNTALGTGGGGVYLYSGGRIDGCTITGNNADNGGGVYMRMGGQLNNCLLLENHASYAGGARFWEGGELNNCTLANNIADTYGGGVHFYNGGSLNNSIAWDNTALSGKDIYTYGYSTIRHSCASDGVVNGQNGCVNSDPMFEAPLSNNFHLQTNSPCINAGNDSYAPPGSDLSGVNRIIGGTVDMGAYETGFEPPTFLVTTMVQGSGEVLPENPSVFQGDDVILEIRPSEDYKIEWLEVDGTPLPAASSYTFTNVQTTHTFKAVFDLNVFYVDANQVDDSQDGRSWATAKKTIQGAVDVAVDGGVVWVANGLYNVGGAVSPGDGFSNRVCISKSITVQSVHGPSVTIIRGAASSTGGKGSDAMRAAFMSDGCLLSGFTLTHGYSGTSAGTTHGGGVLLSSGCVVSNCVMENNAAVYGGGVYLDAGGTVVDCTVRDNQGGNGAGAYLYYGGTIENCTILHNEATGSGGGLGLADGSNANNCIIASNSANYGGGAYMYATTAMNNCLLHDNTATTQGGGVYSAGTLYNCTIYGNSAHWCGGVNLYDDGTLYNSIVWSNMSASRLEDIYREVNSIIRNSCAGTGVTDGENGCTTNTPLFVDVANHDFKLQSASPCIDLGDDSYAPPGNDLSGNPRIIGGAVDTGAYEFYEEQDDFDGDGLANGWESLYYGTILNADTNSICSNGVNTVLEAYVAGLDPTDASAAFLCSLSNVDPAGSILEWNCVSGRVYSVYWSTNLMKGFHSVATNILWPVGTYTDSVHQAQNDGFYRIGVELEP